MFRGGYTLGPTLLTSGVCHTTASAHCTISSVQSALITSVMPRKRKVKCLRPRCTCAWLTVWLDMCNGALMYQYMPLLVVKSCMKKCTDMYSCSKSYRNRKYKISTQALQGGYGTIHLLFS